MMTLYIYDHCPFCTRTRLIAGLKKLAIKEVVLQNDDEATPIGLVGKKVVPILVKQDGTAMAESLDIVQYLDSFDGNPLLTPSASGEIRPEISNWLKEIGSYYNLLTMPRYIKMGLEEYATQSAIDYFVKKKSETIGDFDTHFANTEQYLARLQPDLDKLASLIISEQALNGKLSLEDIQVFPILRQLTCVKGVKFPAKVTAYLQHLSTTSGVPLFTEKAI